jgi:hypothetical protein
MCLSEWKISPVIEDWRVLMFSRAEKQRIAKVVEEVIREIDHPEMDNENIRFLLHVQGREDWSYADIRENSAVHGESSPWNEGDRRS